MNGRFSYLPDHEHATGLYPTVAGAEVNPLALGTLLDSKVASASVSATSTITPNFVIDGLFGFTRQHTYQQPPGPVKCWGAELGIPNACQPPLQRDYALPRIDFAAGTPLRSYGNRVRGDRNTGPAFYSPDPQWEYRAECRPRTRACKLYVW